MAPGYVIAIALETAGLITLALGLILARAERRAKSVELKGFLRSGQPVQLAPRTTAMSRTRPGPAHDVVLASPAADEPQLPSEAREALRRAYPRLPETRIAAPAA
ncbi:hypothetical protein [Methylobacterium durans]|uniref:Uncharacterized protein n=1 Tax=Methylobacterium durans TaxID=2202825 RepID=A0A2U8WCX1_9HYPH|nr:hypothetical protein [Methylobacterium durans]AWN43997.1 hypothetical protein DK389_30205 [Methylobacterium durans]